MSFDDEYARKLDDPFAAEFGLDHEITPTIIRISPINLHITGEPDPELPETTSVHLPSYNIDRKTVDDELQRQLMQHCETGNISKVQEILRNPSVDINAQNERGHTPAMVTIIHNRSSCRTANLLQLLLDNGADPEITDNACFVNVIPFSYQFVSLENPKFEHCTG